MKLTTTELDSFLPRIAFSVVVGCVFGKSGTWDLARTFVRTKFASRQTLVSVLPSVVAFLAFFNGLGGDFVHDDIPAVLKNSDVNGESSCVVNILRNDFWGEPLKSQRSHKSFRPLTTLVFR